MKIGIITCSDRAAQGIYQDLSGPEILALCQQTWPGNCELFSHIVGDDLEKITLLLRDLADRQLCQLIITTGGTGISPRDVTPEATHAVIDKELPGFGELMRAVSMTKTPTAILSRATAGVRGSSLIINLPGNPKAIRECLTPLMPAINDALSHLK